MRTILCILSFVIIFYAVPAQGQSETYSWKNVAIGGGGFVSGIVTSKTEQNLVYARTDVGGAYRWNAATGRWIPLLDWVSEGEIGYLGVESIAIDPVNTNKVYMLVGISYFNNGKTAVLRSDDYGNNFTVVDVTNQFKEDGNGMGRQTGEKLMVDPNSPNILFCGTRTNGLFKSINSGATWSSVSNFPIPATTNGNNGLSFVTLDASTASAGSPTQTIIAGISATGTNLYRSNDGGATFSAISGGPTTLMPHRAALGSDRNLYITYVTAAGPWDITGSGQIWKHNLATSTWTNVTPAAFPKPFGGISVDPANPLRLVASSVNTYLTQGTSYGDRIFLSTNGGTSWTDVVARGFYLDDDDISWINGNAIHWAGCVEFDPFDSKKAWIISGNGIFHTDDIDATTNIWKFTVRGLEETVPLVGISTSNGPFLSAVGDYDGFRSIDADLYAPINKPTMGTTTGLASAWHNPSVMLRVGDKMYYSADLGETWSERTPMSKKGAVEISNDGKVLIHCPEGSIKTYWSADTGVTWTTSLGISVSEVKALADPVNSNKFYAYNNAVGVMMVSTDAGKSFVSAGTVGMGASKIIKAAPDREGDIWVALYAGGLTRSINSAASFTKISSVTACTAVGFGKTAPDKDFPTVFIWGTVNGVTGLFRSIDVGATWKRVNNDAHEYGGPGNGQFVTGDANVFGRVYMSTAGRGIVYGESSLACEPTRIIPQLHIDSGSELQSPVVIAEVGTSVTLSPTAAVDGSWTWKGPGGFTSTSREIVIDDLDVSKMGMYEVTYTNSADCAGSPLVFTVSSSVVKATAIVVSAKDDLRAINIPSGTLQLYGSFSPANVTDAGLVWSVDEPSLASVSLNGVITAISNGQVVVRATATDGSAAFGERTIDLSNQLLATGLKNREAGLSIFPNPGTNVFTIESFEDVEHIEIIDSRGVVVFGQAAEGRKVEIRLGLPSGVYIARILTAKAVRMERLVVGN